MLSQTSCENATQGGIPTWPHDPSSSGADTEPTRRSIPRSSLGIAAARLPGGGFTAAWRGADNDNRIWTAVAPITTNWSRQSLPAGAPRTEDRPALATYGSSVAMAWRGANTDEHIWYTAQVNAAQQPACDGKASSTHGPALADLGDGRLLLAWKSSGGNQRLYSATFDGHTWSEPLPGPGGSTHGPALATTQQGTALMVWKGSGGDDRLWKSSYVNGRWSTQALAVGRSSHGPAIAKVGLGVVMVWKGVLGDERLFWSRDLRSQHEVAPGYTSANTPAITYVDFMRL